MKSALVLGLFILTTNLLAYGFIQDVEKNNDGYVVKWTSCSAFPTLGHNVQVLNNKDILVSFKADQSGSCISPESLSIFTYSYFSTSELFELAGISCDDESKVFIAW